ncbi:hypothetical protein FV113G1_23830 [Fusobacterium varium]|nr:hypothetical protein FV113G1_23830 [Fusobacterium varium]
MINKKIKLNNFVPELEYEVENCCPHCGIYNDPIKINDLQNFSTKDGLKVFVILFKTSCCQKVFSSFYIYDQLAFRTKHIFTYPSVKPHVFDKGLQEVSPNFIKIFNQSKAAEDLGNFELACIGYRTSIEFLLKDFLIRVRKEDENKISKMKLYDVISLFEEKEISISADVVRAFGNDKTHYIAKYDFEISQVKTYLKFLIDAIVKEIYLANPPIKGR